MHECLYVSNTPPSPLHAQLHRQPGIEMGESDSDDQMKAVCALPKPRLLADAERLVEAHAQDTIEGEGGIKSQVSVLFAMRKESQVDIPERAKVESAKADRLRRESADLIARAKALATNMDSDGAVEHRARAQAREAEALHADNEVVRLKAVEINRLDDVKVAEAELNRPMYVAGDCKMEATRLRSEAATLIQNEQFEGAQPLLELAKVCGLFFISFH